MPLGLLMNALSLDDSPHWLLLRCDSRVLMTAIMGVNIHITTYYNCTKTQLAGVRHTTGQSIHRKTLKHTTGNILELKLKVIL